MWSILETYCIIIFRKIEEEIKLLRRTQISNVGLASRIVDGFHLVVEESETNDNILMMLDLS